MGLAPQIRTDQLDRYHSVDENVTSSIDDAHPALTDALLEPVTTRDDLVEGKVVALATVTTGLVSRCLNHVYASKLTAKGTWWLTIASLDVTGAASPEPRAARRNVLDREGSCSPRG